MSEIFVDCGGGVHGEGGRSEEGCGDGMQQLHRGETATETLLALSPVPRSTMVASSRKVQNRDRSQQFCLQRGGIVKCLMGA